MKREFNLLWAAASSLALLSGCHSPSHQPKAAPTTSAPPVVAPVAVTPPAPAAPKVERPTAIRIKAGIGTVKDASGQLWLEDRGFSGGDVIERPDLPIANTTRPEIYRSEHYAMESFSQNIPNGKYEVKLHFCETFEGIGGPGERVFTFEVEGKAFKDFDVWAKAGGGARAYIETVPVEITDGQLNIKFIPQVENPQINGIEIIPTF